MRIKVLTERGWEEAFIPAQNASTQLGPEDMTPEQIETLRAFEKEMRFFGAIRKLILDGIGKGQKDGR